ncbi:hypothetical protein TNIN_410501 [Trichonephila inaurata madagascariensis]|uniref:Uncharacterized protein n=1 Tax=Trichonephila inaurata madagascariensis TaxID=2747483 RepID=A0A8X6IUA2_9ARAC|nr:hypothetical protein TNIN_410501 [Trichonephila inaurata madagascariensis]
MSDANFSKTREGLDIIISSCTELVNLPDTDDNQEMKAILRASIDDAQKKKDALRPDIPSMPERLRLVNLIQWTALKCSRKSIRLQNQEFKDYIREIERLNRIPAAPASQPKRKKAKRQTAEAGTLGAAAPTQHHFPYSY